MVDAGNSLETAEGHVRKYLGGRKRAAATGIQ